MVYSSGNSSRFIHFLEGQCGMEIAVLLLLSVPLTAASPLRQTQRSDANAVLFLPGATVRDEGVERSEVLQEHRAPSLRIIPFHSEGKHVDLDALKYRMPATLRLRRASKRGCQVATCNVHNLASILYELKKRDGKEESTNAKDPQGYGR
ncbi:uncharacterized protein KZ484_016866 [Pholidichthys leucotaenia]